MEYYLFITIISLIGILSGGADAILTALVFLRLRSRPGREPEYGFKIAPFAVYGIISLFILAIALGIALHLRQVHLAVALLAGFYVLVAVLPWIAILFT